MRTIKSLKLLALLPDDYFYGKKREFKRIEIIRNGKRLIFPAETIVFTKKQSHRITRTIRNIIDNLPSDIK